MAEVSGFREELLDVRAQLRVTGRAVELQRSRVDQAQRQRDSTLLDEHVPRIQKIAQRVAEKLVELGDVADELYDAIGAVDELGVSRGHRLPGLRLDPIRASLEPSRANSLIDELESGYGAKVSREIRDAARKRRHEAHLRDEKRKQEAGGSISAGPNGAVHYDVGGKPRRRPEGGVKAGADDFLASASWSAR